MYSSTTSHPYLSAILIILFLLRNSFVVFSRILSAALTDPLLSKALTFCISSKRCVLNSCCLEFPSNRNLGVVTVVGFSCKPILASISKHSSCFCFCKALSSCLVNIAKASAGEKASGEVSCREACVPSLAISWISESLSLMLINPSN